MNADAEPILAVAVDEDGALVTFPGAWATSPDAERQRILNRVAYGLLCYHLDVVDAGRPIDRRLANTAFATACDLVCRFGYGSTSTSVAVMLGDVIERMELTHGKLLLNPLGRRAYLVMAASRLARMLEEKRVPGT